MAILLIDGDVLCYMACKPRWLDKIKDEVVFHNIDSDGVLVAPVYTKEENHQYIKESFENFKKELEFLSESLFTTDYIVAVGGRYNFRNYLYPLYKANRKSNNLSQKAAVSVLRRLLVKKQVAVSSEYCETDDVLRIWAEECRFNGIDYIICTIDKDLKCIPGKYYNLKNKTLETISEEDALRYFYEQLLKGDPVDNIPGLFRVGDVKAKQWLSPYNKEKDFQEIVVTKYIEHYGDNWYDQLLSNGKLLYLQKHKNDYFTMRDWPLVKDLLTI